MALSRSTRVNILIGNGHFLSHFYVLALPPMFLAWQDAFHVSFAELGMTVALMSGTTALLQTPVGFLVDRYGARYFLIFGALVMSLSVAAMGLATSFWHIWLLAITSGIGNSVIHPADYAILSGSVEKERMGRAFALHTFSGNLGFSAGAPVTAFLMAAVGWRSTLLTVGLMGIPVVLMIVMQSGILKDQVRLSPKHGSVSLTWRDLVTSRPMLFFFAFFMLGAMAGGGVTSWLVTVLHTVKAIDLKIAALALTTYMAGSTIGILIGGWFADTYRSRITPFVFCTTALSASSTMMIGLMPMPVMAVVCMAFLSGLSMGSSRTPRDVMLQEAAPPGQIGKVFGFVSSGLPLGGALTPVPFGFLIDRGHPELVLVMVAVLLMLSVCFGGTARVSARGQPLTAAAAE